MSSHYTWSVAYKVTTGPINVASVVKIDPSNSRQVLQAAGPNDDLLGIVQPGAGQLPIDGGPAVTAAATGDSVWLAPPGSLVPAGVGITIWTTGDYLTSDAYGNLVTATPGQRVIAKALDTATTAATLGVVAEFRDVEVLQPGTVCPPLGVSNTTSTFITTAVSITLTAAQSGSTIIVTGADKVITLPTVIGNAGVRFRVLNRNANAAGSTGTLVKLNAADITAANVGTYASGKTYTAGDGLCNTAGTSTQGDWVEVVCDGANWNNVGIGGTWAIHA